MQLTADHGCEKVIASPLKVPLARRWPTDFRQRLRDLYAGANGDQPTVRDAAYRLPIDYTANHLFEPVREICDEASISLVHCKRSLFATQ